MIIGLTGSIAGGKSQALKTFKKMGAYIIDADKISHQLTAKGQPALKELVQYFGKDILLRSGALNRKKLGTIIFNDKKSKLKVEEILHIQIITMIRDLSSQRCRTQHIVIDAPLLFEVGLNKICDKVIVVWVPQNIQEKRLKARDGLSKEQIQKRINAQMPIDKKMQQADYVLDNSGTKKDLEAKVKELFKVLTAR